MKGATEQGWQTYFVYGLTIRSEMALDLPSGDRQAEPDIDFRVGEEIAAPTRHDGEVWVKTIGHNGWGYSLARMANGGWTMAVADIAEFRFTPDLHEIVMHPFLGGSRHYLAMLVSGHLLSILLSLRGEAILHASVVAVDGDAVAFLGGRRAGKSTLAALHCVQHARFVTDDVLRLREEEGAFYCHFGTGRIRIRHRAKPVLVHFPAALVSPTPDGRQSLRLDAGGTALPRLRAFVVPQPSRQCERLECRALGVTEALHHLNQRLRVRGWLVAEPVRRDFAALAQLAKTVPVYEIKLPWGPPFAATLAGELLAAVGLKVSGPGETCETPSAGAEPPSAERGTRLKLTDGGGAAAR